MFNPLFQVSKGHRVERCLFSLFLLCGALALPFAASGYTILYDDYGERIGYERSGFSSAAMTVAIRYSDWNEDAEDRSLVKFGLENGCSPQAILGTGNAILGCYGSSTTNTLTPEVILPLSHEGGVLFAQQSSHGLQLFSSEGQQLCLFKYVWNGKCVVSLRLGDLFTLQDVMVFDSSLTQTEMAAYAYKVFGESDCEWSNFTVGTGARGLSDNDVATFSLDFSTTNYISKCGIPGDGLVRVGMLGVPLSSSTTRSVPGLVFLSQGGVSLFGQCAVIENGATIVFSADLVKKCDLLIARFYDTGVWLDAAKPISVSFRNDQAELVKCSMTCIECNADCVNPVLKISDTIMPLVTVTGDVVRGDVGNAFVSERKWFKLNDVTVTRSYVDALYPNADWTTTDGRASVCSALTAPRTAGEKCNGYTLLDSWALGLDPTNASSVARLNLKQNTSTSLKLGFENVKTNREAFVSLNYAIKHAATLDALESAAYTENCSELTIPLDDIESVQFYRGKISFDPK